MKITLSKNSSDNWFVNDDYAKILEINNIMSPSDLWDFKGESVKNFLKERGTERAYLKLHDGVELETYIKRYLPLPLKEYIKAVISLKPLFKLGAIHEWNAILAFHRNDIPTMIPIAAGVLPDGRSVNITLGITDYIRASEFFAQKLEREKKNDMIEKIAQLAGLMHCAGFAHQDFYLVHLFIKNGDFQVLPIDLQRLIMGNNFSRRWQIKDLAQLLFSSRTFVTNSDIIRFWKKYTLLVDEKLYGNKNFIKRVIRKSERIQARSDRKKKRKL